jgi:RNA polymerase sigma-70 factor (ECF subfamily)
MTEGEIDKDVVRRARDGDAGAFRRVAEAYERRLFRIAYRIVFDAEEARDLCQEILLRVYMNLERYDPERPFEPWLHRVATNVCLNRRKRPRRVEAVGGTDELDRRAPPVVPEGGPGDSERLRQAVAGLPDAYRTVLALRYEAGQSYEEIARATGQPLGTVKTWIFRAKEQLRAAVAENARISDRA